MSRLTRLAGTAALVAGLAIAAPALAADPGASAPPGPVVDWQTHLDHMRSMGAPLGIHVEECIDVHGSIAGQLGPNGSMVQMMADGWMDGGMMR